LTKLEIAVGTPPISTLILELLGIEKGLKDARKERIGNLIVEQAKKIASMKRYTPLGVILKENGKEVIGKCISMGLIVVGKYPREL
jgi:large subunit ribosomal protein L11